jgi:penicillin-binding protein 2
MTKNPARSRCAFSLVTLLIAFLIGVPDPGLLAAATRSRTLVHPVRHHHARYRGVPAHVDPTRDDVAEFDDPIVRQVAVQALGHVNGSVLAVDPANGRVLSVVNQKLAFSAGYEPCSTIKPVIAIAALQMGIINHNSMLPVGRRRYMDLTEAMAHSNNIFFEELGQRLGFDTVSHYAQMLGLGERAGLNIAGEQPGLLPGAPPARGGVARMSSFGEGIRITPFQLASVAATLANGGTMYYLQYPRTDEGLRDFVPQVKRQLDIASLLPDVRDGMLAAVLYGTARRSYDPEGETALGKTGTCDDQGGRLGWYVSYTDPEHPRVVLVVLLRGSGRRVSGPRAADVAGRIYRGLREHNYFAEFKPNAVPSLADPANR